MRIVEHHVILYIHDKDIKNILVEVMVSMFYSKIFQILYIAKPLSSKICFIKRHISLQKLDNIDSISSYVVQSLFGYQIG